MNNIFNSGIHGVSIPLTGLEVTINGNVYKDPICIARLLTVDELERVNRFDTTSPKSRALIEEDIIENTFESFIGITSDVDWGDIEAGIITTIVDAIVLKSVEYASDIISSLEEFTCQINILHSIQAIVSRFTSTPFSDVEDLPISELLRRYAICIATFPEEVRPPQQEE